MGLKRIVSFPLVILILFGLSTSTSAETFSQDYWYKGGDAGYKYKTYMNDPWYESDSETVTMTNSAWMSDTTAEGRVHLKGFARIETIKDIYGDYPTKIDTVKLGLADADSRSSMWITEISPGPSSSETCVPDYIWDMLGFIPGAVQVLTNSFCGDSIEHNEVSSPGGYHNKNVEFWDAGGLSLTINADNSYWYGNVEEYAKNRASNGINTGINAHFRFSIGETNYTNYVYRPYVQITYVQNTGSMSYPIYTNQASNYYNINTN